LAQKTSKYNVSIKAEDVYGKWVVAQVMTMNAFLGIPEPKAAPVDTATHNAGQTGDTTLAARQAALKARISNHLSEIQAKSTLVLSPDNTGVKYIGMNPFNITWKLKKNIISAKNIKTKDKIRMEVVKFSADQLMVIEHSQYGDTYISYKRSRQ
jgi:hypothetical protein